MPIIEHAAFRQPINDNQKLWRFMDFSKFVDLLNSEELFFTRPGVFEDVFEGAIPSYVIDEWSRDLGMPASIGKEFILGNNKFFCNCYGVSCWHQNEYESAAMWNLYLKSNDGIAIQTTFGRLKRALSNVSCDMYAGLVNYIDYTKDNMDISNAFSPILYKRKSFEHEMELRILTRIENNVHQFYSENIKIEPEKGVSITKCDNFDKMDPGVKIKVDLSTLIESIYIAPSSPSWIENLIRDTCRRFNLNTSSILKSNLNQRPVY